jgi:hypothetical protein
MESHYPSQLLHAVAIRTSDTKMEHFKHNKNCYMQVL